MSVDRLPSGFQAETDDSGDFVVQYRTSGKRGEAVYIAIWLAGWTVGSYVFTHHALFAPVETAWTIDGLLIIVIASFWVIEIATLCYFAWHFFSVTEFKFRTNELMVERSLFSFKRRRVYLRREISRVKQMEHSDEGFPSWNLVLIGEGEYTLLSQQPKDKSDWLGPRVATWADVDFDPVENGCMP